MLPHPKSNWGKMFLTSLLQLTAYHSVPFWVYLAFGLNGQSAIAVVGLQAVLFLSVSSLPLPGAVGLTEGLPPPLPNGVSGGHSPQCHAAEPHGQFLPDPALLRPGDCLPVPPGQLASVGAPKATGGPWRTFSFQIEWKRRPLLRYTRSKGLLACGRGLFNVKFWLSRAQGAPGCLAPTGMSR